MRRILPVLVMIFLAGVPQAHAQAISTYAGGVVLEDQPATSTPLNVPRGVAVDFQGNLFIVETAGGLVRRVDAVTGIATIVAGGGTQLDDARPIPGRQVALDGPTHGGVDGLGNFYFCDTNNHRIHKITTDGMITTVVGTGLQGFSGDGGPATRAHLSSPEGIYVDVLGNLWISDSGNGRIRMVSASTGIIQTVAGGGTGGEGSKALEVGLAGPRGVTRDSKGNIFVVAGLPPDGRTRILRIDASSGVVTTMGGGGTIHSGAGFDSTVPTDPKSVDLCGAQSVAVDAAGNVYYDSCPGVRRISVSDGLMRVYFGGLGYPGGGHVILDGSGLAFAWPVGLVFRIQAENSGRTVAGTADPLDGLFATAAVLGTPVRLSLDTQGNLYIADNNQARIRRVDAKTTIISTVTTSDNSTPVHVDRAGNIYYAGGGAGIAKMEAGTGKVTTVVGRALAVPNIQLADGMKATDARVIFVSSLVADSSGNLFFTAPGDRVWMVEASTGLLRLVAGNGTSGNSGDGGPGKDASLANPNDLALDGRGNLLIAQLGFGRLRQVNLSTGVISSVPVDLGGGQSGVAVDGRGNIYVSVPNLVGVIVGGKFVTVAGTRQRGFFGDGGIPTLAKLSGPQGLAVDADGSLYIADTGNARIRKVTALAVTPVLAVKPASLVFSARQGQAPPSPQALTVTGGNLLPLAWTADVSTDRGGTWLAVSPASGAAPTTVLVAVNPAGLSPGTYAGAINIVSSGASGSPQTISVTFNVLSTNPPAIGLSQQFLSFAALQGGVNPPPQTISLTNTGGGTLSFAVQTETSGGGGWLQVATSSGTAPATLTVRANAVGLGPGLYQGLITIKETSTGELRTIAVSLLVSRAVPILQVSQTGLLFLGVEGNLTLRPQTLLIQNRGQGVMNWRVQASVAGAGDWLKVSPTSGSSDASKPEAAPSVTVTVEPTQLRAGVFSGLLTIVADGAPNSPFVVLVLVSMQPAGSEPVGIIQPAGLIFTTPSGSTAPLTQEVNVSTTGGKQLQFLAGVRTQSGGNWLSLSPTGGTLLGSTDSVKLQLTVSPAGLGSGVYVATLTVAFGTGLAQDVAIALVVTPPGTTAAGAKRPEAAAAECSPTKLVMVETQLVQNFRTNVGWPTPLLVQMVNDCAQKVTDATLLASFSNGDPALVLSNLGNGFYSGTWVPTTQSTNVNVTLNAIHAALGQATVRLSGSLAAADTPILFRNGAVSGASFKPFAPLAVGTIFSVFGRNLEKIPAGAVQLPLPKKLGDTSVKLGDVDVPLIFAGPGQINAQVPYELPTGATASLVVKKGDVFTTPEVVTIVPAQPAIFTTSQSGSGQGAVLDAKFRVVDSTNPATGGDVVQVFATGLGLTNPAVATGTAAPSSPTAQVVTAVTVTIGGLQTTVEFAGLAPGFVGLYQVNVRVPAGLAPSSSVPLVIAQAGVASNTVTLAVK